LAPAINLPGGCTGHLDPVTWLLTGLGNTTAAGLGRIGVPLPPVAALRSATLYAQAGVLDRTGALGSVLTAGLSLRLGD
jgi:hypothetical protein